MNEPRVRVVGSPECKFQLDSVVRRDPAKALEQDRKPTRAVFSGDKRDMSAGGSDRGRPRA